MSDENVVDLVEAAHKKGKFNLADAIKGRSYPEKAVDVYIDAGAAFELNEINQRMQEIADGDGEMSEYDELRKKADEVTQRILDSKLTFHMRGTSQKVVERVTEEANKLYPPEDQDTDNPNWIRYYLCALIAENIFKVTDSDGNEDTSKFTVNDIIELRSAIPIDAWEVLIETMQQLTLANSYFDAVTDAGFLPKS